MGEWCKQNSIEISMMTIGRTMNKNNTLDQKNGFNQEKSARDEF